MNNPLQCPEQLEYRGRKLDPEFDFIPEEQEIFEARTADGQTYLAYGEAKRDELIEWLEDNEEEFVLFETGRYGFDPDAFN
jgi:hypothetical protein